MLCGNGNRNREPLLTPVFKARSRITAHKFVSNYSKNLYLSLSNGKLKANRLGSREMA
jgi:hypothetical protein